ncbi:MAG: hypothetical protein V5A38_07480 [Halolamina sp.]|uniref:hypothetical protein n=1 Tax=Halolamina sp. TaxID=1940283 RepID=UPI002FC368A2
MEYSEERESPSTEETLDQIEAGLYRALSAAEGPEVIYEIRTSLQRLDVLRKRRRERALRSD